MFGFDAQHRIQEALRRIDQSLLTNIELEDEVQKQAQNFRDMIFGAYQYIERESLQLKALFIQLRRLDANQLQVQSRGRTPFILLLDPDLAYDRKGPFSSNEGAPANPESVELAARLFVVLAPPYQGLLRYYTIFADGSWKRSMLTTDGGGVIVQNTMVPRFSPDMLVMEAIDLLGQVCTLHPTWASLVSSAESLTFDSIRERNRVKDHPTGLTIHSPAPAGTAAPAAPGPRLRKIGTGSLGGEPGKG